jgi:predicted DsbA family dithiol-disulfide isomerase
MEKAKVYLFTSPTCPHCPSAKKFADEFKKTRDDFQLIDMSMATREGEKAAKKYDVMSVPTFIIRGPGYPGPIGLRGIQSKETMNKFIDVALGLKSLEDFRKPTLGEKLREWINA